VHSPSGWLSVHLVLQRTCHKVHKKVCSVLLHAIHNRDPLRAFPHFNRCASSKVLNVTEYIIYFLHYRSCFWVFVCDSMTLRLKHHSSVAMQLLLRDGITYSIVVWAAISTDCAQNTITLLLSKGRCLVMASCCDSTLLALSKHATKFYQTASINQVQHNFNMKFECWKVNSWYCWISPSLRFSEYW
jgi:hypothetical protein